MATTESIVVGVDGSAGSAAALRWALAEARLRGVPLKVIHAYEAPRLALGDLGLAGPVTAVPPITAEDLDRLRDASESEARRVIEETLEQADAKATDDLDVRRELIEGPAAQVLLDAGREAALLVVGSRGRGGFAGLLLGSVSQQLTQHPPCPVVVLPPVEAER
jgi:nucleotide-binding universal stress UspA family protein